MQINKISSFDLNTLLKILSSNKLSEAQKTRFVLHNKNEIEEIMKISISSHDFNVLMDKRNLIIFRPIKNIFTKKGDRIILAKALDVDYSEIPNYVKTVAKAISDSSINIDSLTANKMEILKTYVYRHGTKDELINFFNYELSKTKNLENLIYSTLTYKTGGIADYFSRPIHRMSNNTYIKLYSLLFAKIENAKAKGNITEEDANNLVQWAAIKLYEIKSNSKIINAVKNRKNMQNSSKLN